MIDQSRCHHELEELGFTILPSVYTVEECATTAGQLQQVLHNIADESVALRRQNGVLYGARNLLDVFPAARTLWRRSTLTGFLSCELGPVFGLVRGLYFDKPPDGNWSLPWHQDLTIAVKDHSLPSRRFRNRTIKAGIPHVEAPREVLEQMLTLRIHLDDVDDENGPLQVIPGSHRAESTNDSRSPITIHAGAGDVLVIRPLVSHASGASAVGTHRHRRILHLEFAASLSLPDEYQWQHFFSVSDCQPGRARSN